MTQDDLSWELYVDGFSNKRDCGAGLLLLSPEGDWFEYALRFGFRVSNNEAEYKAFLAGLRLAIGIGVTNLVIYSDSPLIVN